MGFEFTNDWDDILGEEFEKHYFMDLKEFLKNEYEENIIFPKKDEIFRAFELTPYNKVKTVILGQDPYYREGQAHGLSFSVKKGIAVPKSLQNIFRELHDDLGFEPPTHGCLEHWAQEGVLLLNTVLTVREGNPASHSRRGWEIFTDEVIRKLNMREKPMAFILWGNRAISKRKLINGEKHKIVMGAHPSPLSCYKGFFGGKYFSKVNDFLDEPIDWKIT